MYYDRGSTADSLVAGRGRLVGRGSEGKGRVTKTLDLRELLATPWIAIVLGVILGVALLLPLVWTLRRIKPGNVDVGVNVGMAAVFGGLLVGLGLMVGYMVLSPEGFWYFGPAVAGGFIVALGVLSWRVAAKMLSTDDEQKG